MVKPRHFKHMRGLLLPQSRSFWCALLCGLAVFATSPALHASNVTVAIDIAEARGVLDAVRNPQLTLEEGLKVAQLPGSQGLIRKALSYGRPADNTSFAKALVAAAHHDPTFSDPSKFRFDVIRDHATQTERVLVALSDPKLHLVADVESRIALFTPNNLAGTVTGHLVVGGTSYGFAFGDPQFYLDLDFVPSAVLASTIMKHELFHAIQSLAQSAHKPSTQVLACIAQKNSTQRVEDLFSSLSKEGTASYVGDLLALPAQGTDEPTAKERAEFAGSVDLINLRITQMELSVHGLATNASVTPEEVYAAGFYGDQVFYALGYVMARAIAKEQGDTAISALISESGAEFVMRYVHLKNYGKSDEAPALDHETVLLAQQITACSVER